MMTFPLIVSNDFHYVYSVQNIHALSLSLSLNDCLSRKETDHAVFSHSDP